ncbi:MAG: peptidoglycan synthetase, partial [Bacteroidetes bacterium]|nr:peptidoglycan synthetase [Bacteroidota bacterium]
RLIACIELHTFSSLNKDFLEQYSGTMDEADEAIVFIDQKTFEQKKMTPYPAETVRNAFSRLDLQFYNDPELLENHLQQVEMKDTNLLMMSSGNFGGIDLPGLSVKIL